MYSEGQQMFIGSLEVLRVEVGWREEGIGEGQGQGRLRFDRELLQSLRESGLFMFLFKSFSLVVGVGEFLDVGGGREFGGGCLMYKDLGGNLGQFDQVEKGGWKDRFRGGGVVGSLR